MAPPKPTFRGIRIVPVVRCLLFATGFAIGAVPLSQGEAWDGAGLGGTLTAGPTWKSDEGLTPNHVGSQLWYHYQPDLVGSMGIEMSDWAFSRTKALFTTQYVGALSWIPLSSSQQILNMALRFGGESVSTTLDTASHALPLTDQGWDWQIGLRVGGGWSAKDLGAWVSTGPVGYWRVSGAASGWTFAQESEVGLLLNLQKLWSGSAGYTRSWGLAIRIPMVYQPNAPTFTRQGVVKQSEWSIGLQIGPSVLF
jgi:hypothetical protein